MMILKSEKEKSIVLSQEGTEVEGVDFKPLRDGVRVRNSCSPYFVGVTDSNGKERTLPVSTSRLTDLGAQVRIGNRRYLIGD